MVFPIKITMGKKKVKTGEEVIFAKTPTADEDISENQFDAPGDGYISPPGSVPGLHPRP